MYEEINSYREWNKALFDFYFPTRNEDALLSVDTDIINDHINKTNISKSADVSWVDAFFAPTLLSGESLSNFASEWNSFTGKNSSIGSSRSWTALVRNLCNLRFPDETPAYFAILCSILLLASIAGTKHANINKEAKKYLGPRSNDRPGELVDMLLQQLHADVPGFNPNRMLYGSRRHISRIHYHLVQKKKDRDDFIDFIEVNNLKWEYEPYDFYINNILIPALDKAGKRGLIYFVLQDQSITYVKNLLRSKQLQFGKPKSAFENHVVQVKSIKWRYDLEFDFSGEQCFSIVSDYYNTPFNIQLNGTEFICDPNDSFCELIASSVDLKSIPQQDFSLGTESYQIANISDGLLDGCFYFERVSNMYYRQVDTLQEGHSYYLYVPERRKVTLPQGSHPVDFITCPGYTIYEVENYIPSAAARRAVSRDRRSVDQFDLVHFGSWLSIRLAEGQTLYWKPLALRGANGAAEAERVTDMILGKDGKTYFRLNWSGGSHLSADIIVKDSDGNEIHTEQISHDFEWNGESANYYMNGWGEITNSQPDAEPVHRTSNSRQLRQCDPKDRNVANQLRSSDILLQVLYDLADENGCVSSRKMVAAINFVLACHGVVNPNPSNRRKLIYALRRLGYIIAYYDVAKREHVNQLLSKYIQKTNFSFNTHVNAYVVKGVYDHASLTSLFRSGNITNVYRLRPYSGDGCVEYSCLPDFFFCELRGECNWMTVDYQVSDYMISLMANMKHFEGKFLDSGARTQYLGSVTEHTPCMIKTSQDRELLCVQDRDGIYYIHEYYRDGYLQRRIPKHIARVYAQNKRNMPVALMRWSHQYRAIDYSKMYFISGMGVPEVLDIALCDASLCMPSSETVFVVNQEELGCVSSNPLTTQRIYSPRGLDNNLVAQIVNKLSGISAQSTMQQTLTHVYVTHPIQHWRMYHTPSYSHKKGLITLYYGEDLLAFAIGADVYAYSTGSRMYYKVEGLDVNKAFSEVYRNNIDQYLGEQYNGSVPNPQTRVEVTIIDRHI